MFPGGQLSWLIVAPDDPNTLTSQREPVAEALPPEPRGRALFRSRDTARPGTAWTREHTPSRCSR